MESSTFECTDTVHFVYSFWGKHGELLYVGESASPAHRFSQHKWSKDWWCEVHRITVELAPDRYMAKEREKALIQTLRPFYNVNLKGRKPNRYKPTGRASGRPRTAQRILADESCRAAGTAVAARWTLQHLQQSGQISRYQARAAYNEQAAAQGWSAWDDLPMSSVAFQWRGDATSVGA